MRVTCLRRHHGDEVVVLLSIFVVNECESHRRVVGPTAEMDVIGSEVEVCGGPAAHPHVHTAWSRIMQEPLTSYREK